MSMHQHDSDADELWTYFQKVIHWVSTTFTAYRSEMKGIQWGPLFDAYGQRDLNSDELEISIRTLLMDDDVTNKKGVYAYVLSGDERNLAVRAFSQGQRREAYERQNGVCVVCGETFDISEMDADHITPWSKGGKTNATNCQMLCLEDNRRKGSI